MVRTYPGNNPSNPADTYGSLTGNVIYLGTDIIGVSPNVPMQIGFTAASGYQITGLKFQAAGYGGASYNVGLGAIINGTTYNAPGGFTAPGSGSALINSTSFGYGVAIPYQSSFTLLLEPQNEFAAFDNFSVTVSAIPEPGEWAMMLAGLGALGLIVRRRQKTMSA